MSSTIEYIRDYQTGLEFTTDIYLENINYDDENEREGFLLRDKLLNIARTNKNKFLVCATCNQPLTLCGGGNTKQQLHFRHYQDNESCPIITKIKYNQKDIDKIRYNGAKESLLHIQIKEFIYKQIKKDNRFTHEALEKVVKSISEKKLWRKPDVSSNFLDKKIAFEIQLQTTYLNTIRDREDFFKNEKIYIMWFFHNTNMEKFRFSEKDIFYANKSNAFVITEETMMKSEKENKFLFACYYKIPFIENKSIKEKWGNKIISIDDLKFDNKSYKVYYYDFEKEKNSLNNKLMNKESTLWLKELEKCKWYEYSAVDSQLKTLMKNYNLSNESKIIKILLVLYSVKKFKAIGWDNNSLIWTLNTFFQHNSNYSYIIIKMISKNELWDKIKTIDRNHTFEKKVTEWKRIDKSEYDRQYEQLFISLFPELAL